MSMSWDERESWCAIYVTNAHLVEVHRSIYRSFKWALMLMLNIAFQETKY